MVNATCYSSRDGAFKPRQYSVTPNKLYLPIGSREAFIHMWNAIMYVNLSQSRPGRGHNRIGSM